MENQQDLDQPVTRREFQEFASFAAETFSTKEDVRRIVEKSEGRMMEAYRQIITSNDGIAKEVKAMRQEQAAHFGSHKRQDEEIVQVKRRLDKVEAHVGLT